METVLCSYLGRISIVKMTILLRAIYRFNMLLLLRRFSRVRHCVTPQTAAHQAPLSLGFSRQEHGSGSPLPSPMHESEKSEVAQSCPTLSDPTDCSLPGSSGHGIFQASVPESGATAFSDRFNMTLIKSLKAFFIELEQCILFYLYGNLLLLLLLLSCFSHVLFCVTP